MLLQRDAAPLILSRSDNSVLVAKFGDSDVLGWLNIDSPQRTSPSLVDLTHLRRLDPTVLLGLNRNTLKIHTQIMISPMWTIDTANPMILENLEVKSNFNPSVGRLERTASLLIQLLGVQRATLNHTPGRPYPSKQTTTDHLNASALLPAAS